MAARFGILDLAGFSYPTGRLKPWHSVLTLCPSRQDARHALALVLLKSRNTREGIETLVEILKIDPTDSRALTILGK